MADNTIGWGQGSVNNTNDWGKGKANSTNDWGSIYANSPSGDTNIEGGSAVNPDLFIIQVKTDNTGTSNNDQFTLPMVAGTYDVDWGDGNVDLAQTGTQTHTYASAGTYDIRITTTNNELKFNNGGDKLKLLEIKQWGTGTWLRFNSSFKGCSNLDITATDIPDISAFNFSMLTAFMNCTSLVWNTTINNWNTSSVTSMSGTFRGSTFNQNIDNWDLSSCTNLSDMFVLNNVFNQPIGAWNTSNVTNMFRMLRDGVFDQDISNWQVSQVTSISDFMNNLTLSTANYDALLIAWDAQGAMSFSGTVNFGGSQYTLGGAAEAARTSLIAKWGGITDGGGV